MSKEVRFSQKQLDAIEKKGQNILVSASAGSGKTTVLIERIFHKIQNEGFDVNEMLIVTFTEAAANEMKVRLRKRLNSALLQDPLNKHLRKQLTLLPNANISTFHSFCNQIISKFFYLIDVEAKYKVGEEIEIYLIQDETLEALFDSLYEANDEKFMLLVNRFTKNTNDENLKTIISHLYDKLRSIPFREPFIKEVFENYDLDDTLKSWKYYNLFKKQVELLLEKSYGFFKNALELANLSEHDYRSLYEDDYEVIKTIKGLLKKDRFNEIYDYVNTVKFNRYKGNSKVDDYKELIKNYRDSGKNIVLKDIRDNYFNFREETHVKIIRENKDILEALLYVVDLYEQAFKTAKKERNLVDFSDLEEMALHILSINEFDNEATTFFKSLFKEILVDEYQDTNSLQETILSSVSNGKNIFMVGDVKQSIYRFRNAEPEIFQKNYKAFSKESSDGLVINLNANYRSREDIIDFVNYVFKQIMDEDCFEINYDKDAELKFGQTAYTNLDDELISLSILDMESIQEKADKKYDKLEMEAHYISQKIRQLIDSGALIFDPKKNMMREIKYQDIVILSRSVKNEQAVFHDVFKAYNIPILTTDLTGYFNSVEVMTVVSILQTIDNPIQDIPLVASLRSPIFNINEKELIELKVTSNKDNYYDKILDYLKIGTNETLRLKLKSFISQLQNWREAIKNEPLSDLIFSIYHDTNYYDYVLGQLGGKQRQANLDLLYDRAKSYESLTSNSLFKFIRLIYFLNKKEKDLQQARTVSENEDLVRFMSIHKSKGLEFPVVFLTNLNKEYNTMDEKEQILFSKDLGIGFGYLDLDRRVKYDTLYQRLIKDALRKQMLAEEMRLLYVAFTRAKERLYLVGSFSKSLDKELMSYFELCSYNEVVLPEADRHKTNYLNLIMLSLARHPKFASLVNALENTKVDLGSIPNCFIHVIDQLDFNTVDDNESEVHKEVSDEYIKLIDERINAKYSYQERTTHFAKQTIADIKRNQSGISDFAYSKGVVSLNTPKFIKQNNAVLRGTSYHVFMQHINYKKELTIVDLEEIKNTLINKEILTNEQANLIDLNKINAFLNTNLAKAIRNAEHYHTELPFTTLVNAKEVYPDIIDDVDILVQGVIDLLVIFDKEVYLIDFKSDRITKDDIEKVKKQYKIQLEFYEKAIKNIYDDKNIKVYLYLLEVNEFIEM